MYEGGGLWCYQGSCDWASQWNGFEDCAGRQSSQIDCSSAAVNRKSCGVDYLCYSWLSLAKLSIQSNCGIIAIFPFRLFFSVASALRCKRFGESIIQYLNVFAVFPLFVEITIISQLWRRQITHVKHKVSLFAHFLHHDVERGTNWRWYGRYWSQRDVDSGRERSISARWTNVLYLWASTQR